MLVSKEILIPSTVVRRNPPVNLKHGDESFFQQEYERVLPDIYVWKLTNVNVSAEGTVFKGLKLYDQNLIHASHRKDFNLRYLLSKQLKFRKLKFVSIPQLQTSHSGSNQSKSPIGQLNQKYNEPNMYFQE